MDLERQAEGAGQAIPASVMDAEVTLKREAIRQVAPTIPGGYRVRHEANEPLQLIEIGQTGGGVQLEFSCAPVRGEVETLRGTEDMLLWRQSDAR